VPAVEPVRSRSVVLVVPVPEAVDVRSRLVVLPVVPYVLPVAPVVPAVPAVEPVPVAP